MSNTAKFICFATQKGGSGKSFLCLSTAVTLYKRTKHKILVIDADFQQTIFKARELDESEDTEGFEIIPFNYETDDINALIKYAQDNYDIVLVDTPGRLQGSDIQMLLAVSDYVITPIVAAAFDISSTMDFASTISELKDEFGFSLYGVLNKKDQTSEHKVIEKLEFAGLKMFESNLRYLARYKRLSSLEEIAAADKKFDEFNLYFKEFKEKCKIK
ncbi:MAG: ParA family protein [Bacteroidota bacterium]